MKLIHVLIILTSLVLLSACSNPERMFKLHVLDQIPAGVEPIQFMKDRSAMHGPMFFQFQGSSDIVRAIIEKHKLKPTPDMPDIIETINGLPGAFIPWWKSHAELMKLQKHSVWYDPKAGTGDWKMKCLYIDGGQLYFITTGFFEPSDYVVRELNTGSSGLSDSPN